MISVTRYGNWGRRLLWSSSHFVRVPQRCAYPYSTCPTGMKITICGAAGCTGKQVYKEDDMFAEKVFKSVE